MTTIAAASSGMPASRASPAATHSSTASRWVSWASSRRPGCGPEPVGSSLNPSRRRRSSTSATVRPGSVVELAEDVTLPPSPGTSARRQVLRSRARRTFDPGRRRRGTLAPDAAPGGWDRLGLRRTAGARSRRGGAMSSPVLTFLGAADTVTGSRFDVALDRQRILVDAGLYQGRAALRRRNWEASGSRRQDRRGRPDATPTWTTAATCRGWCARASPVRSCARGRPPSSPRSCCATARTCRGRTPRYANESGYSKHHPALPLYDDRDVERHAAPVRARSRYDAQVDLDARTCARRLRPAGHILGSSTVAGRGGRRPGRCSAATSAGRGTRCSCPPATPPAADDDGGRVDVRRPRAPRARARAARRRHPAHRRTRGIGADPGVRRRPHRARADRPAPAAGASGQVPRVPVFVDSPMALAALERLPAGAAGDGSASCDRRRRELLAALDALDLRRGPGRGAARCG